MSGGTQSSIIVMCGEVTHLCQRPAHRGHVHAHQEVIKISLDDPVRARQRGPERERMRRVLLAQDPSLLWRHLLEH